MLKRYFYIEDYGQWYAGVRSSARFGNTPEEAAESLAAGLDVKSVTCTEVKDGTDPRSGDLYAAPPAAPTPEPVPPLTPDEVTALRGLLKAGAR